MNWHDVLTAMLPEHLLLVGMLALLAHEVFTRRERGGYPIAILAVAGSGLAAAWLASSGYAAEPFVGHYAVDPAASLAKALLAALTLPALLLARDDFEDTRFYVLALASLYGAQLLAGATSFPTLFLAIEILSLPLYVMVLAAFLRPESPEAALKYLVLGGTATATLLMGVALIYGWSATLDLGAFRQALAAPAPLAAAGAALVVAALALKAALVPLHAWAPDAYDGASVPVTAYMATVVKAAVLVAMLRLFGDAPAAGPVVGLLAVLPLASMAWGNLAAIRQDGFRRMIAYSSIAHAGYLFFALLGAPEGRSQAVMFYLAAYGVMNLLAFAALPRGVDDSTQDRLDALKGLWSRRPYAAVAIAVAMLSLAGLPPLPGFIAKFLIFRNVMAAGHPYYAVAGLVASYFGIYFYLRVVQYMFMSADEPGASRGRARRHAVIAAVLCAVPAVLLALFPGWLLELL